MSEERQNWQRRLESIEENCRTEGWDSYGAAPISDGATDAARWVCESLDVVPGVNGDVNVILLSEAVTITISPKGTVTGFFLDSEDANSTIGAYTARRNARRDP